MLYLEVHVEGRVLRWALAPGDYVLGRGPDCDIVVPWPSVSRRHARLRVVDGSAVFCKDLGSRHGLLADGQRAEELELEPQQEFQLGEIRAVVRKGITVDGMPLDLGSVHGLASDKEATLAEAGPRLAEQVRNLATGWRPTPSTLAAVVRALREGEGSARLSEHWLRLAAEGSGAHAAALVHRPGEHNVLLASVGLSDPDILAADGPPVTDTCTIMVPAGPASGSAPGRARVVLTGVRDGAAITPAVELFALLAGWCARIGPDSPAIAPAFQTTEPPKGCTPKAERDVSTDREFIALSDMSLNLLAEIDGLAGVSLPVFLHGESGVGKELLARRIHAMSARRDGPFVAINCAALPSELLEAELFGIVRGVATGVDGRPGWMVRATDGTFFLDEVGDLPERLQPKLLRALESHQIFPVGSRDPVDVDIRLISASHRPLRELCDEGRFRSDLLYRLAGATVRVPPLRERPDEILPLAQRFIEESSRRQSRHIHGIGIDAARLLIGYPWPGNVRELKHVIERAVALCDGPVVHAQLLPDEITGASDETLGQALLGLSGDLRSARTAFDRLYFTHLLRRHGGNMSEVARIAGLSRSSLYRQLESLGLRESAGPSSSLD